MTRFTAAILFFFLMILSGLNTSADNHVSRDVREKLRQVKSMDDFRRVFQIDDSNEIYKRGEGADAVDAQQAECEPRPVVHQIPNHSPGSEYYPACIMIHRCSGCCSPISTYQCEAETTQTVSVRIFQFWPDGSQPARSVIYDYANHTSCHRACRTKPTDCVGKQVFDKDNCECVCKVPEEQKKCSNKKQWSDIKCDCVCKNENCPPGTKLNKETCNCDPVDDEYFADRWLVDTGFEQ